MSIKKTWRCLWTLFTQWCLRVNSKLIPTVKMRDSFIYLGKSCFWYNVDIKAELVTDTNKYFDNLNRLPYIRSTSWWLFWSIFIVNVDAGGSRTAAKSKVKLIVIIVTDFQPLTIITKSSTLDVVTVLGPPLSGDFLFITLQVPELYFI